MVDQNPSARNDPVYFLLVALLLCYTPFYSSGVQYSPCAATAERLQPYTSFYPESVKVTPG